MKPALLALALLLAIAPLPLMVMEVCASMSCCCAEPPPQPASCCSTEPVPRPTPCSCQLKPHEPADAAMVFTASPPSRDRAPTVLQPSLAPTALIATDESPLFNLVVYAAARYHAGLAPPFEVPLFLSLSVLLR